MEKITELLEAKNRNEPISVITCYDYSSAKIVEKSNVDAILVGDSVAMVIHGFENTINATVEMIETHVKAVRKGTKKLIIADLPFLAQQKGEKFFFSSVDKMLKAGANSIKIEGTAGATLNSIKLSTSLGIPIVGHLGLTPQSIQKLGGYKIQGKVSHEAETMLQDAKLLEDVGCSAIVLELVPSDLAEEITNNLSIPTIGIGAGNSTSGQVLVMQDLLGMDKNFNPKFLKKYLNASSLFTEAFNKYSKEVKQKEFPSDKESY
ncbi:MAG: 3-methyl-2-oxobutanoate hydroxymethyltransferase [Ignavibacteriae bacterium]|nr:MAG: 3-methyl-2-oxobutanoate hydroxymethyltransferase [Ignavibacteriota bacterium]